ncbi:MAG: DUF6427 family protein [Bacteroidales bacterium]
MLLRLFKNYRLSGMLFIIVLMIFPWLHAYLNPPPPNQLTGMPFYELLFNGLNRHPFSQALMGMIFFGTLLIMITRFNVIHFMLEDRTYMPVFFYILITASFPPVMQLSPILVSTPFLLMAMLMLIRGDEHRANPLALFNASLLLAAGSLFYLKIILFIPFLWITASVIRPLKWRGIVNPILVVLMMVLFFVTYLWVFKEDLTLFPELLQKNLSISSGEFQGFDTPVLVLFSYLLFLLLVSGVHLMSRFKIRKIIIRKLYNVMFLLFIYCLLFYLFIAGYRAEIIFLLAIPMAYLFSNFFYRKRNHWIHELMIWIWIGLLAWVYVEPSLNFG